MKKVKKIVASVLVAFSLFSSMSFAAIQEPKTDTSGFSPIEAYQKQESEKNNEATILASQEKTLVIPSHDETDNGKLIVRAWISTFADVDSGVRSYDYLVSSEYEGERRVRSIRTTWQLQASLRNGASLNMGFGTDSVSAGQSSTWTTVKSAVKYYENTNGAKGAYMPSKSNFVVAPSKDYRTGTATVFNTGKVVLHGVPGSHSYTAAVSAWT